ncbi:MAG: pyridoxamine 5'-phosphate oxidase family protein, partial [Gemmatimonadota bacterium]|nr:pyridoxamine 5'-phosphate oxidase family protein [Gemmatimonadota bacterium]
MPTQAELDELQTLIDRSTAAAGPYLRRTFELPDHALSAAQLTRYWDGRRQIALATVTTSGAPRVAPVDALMRGARFYVPTVRDAARVRHVRARVKVSWTHWISNRIAVVAHGNATVVEPGNPDFESVDPTYAEAWWLPLRVAGSGVYVRIAPDRLYTWALIPAHSPANNAQPRSTPRPRPGWLIWSQLTTGVPSRGRPGAE